MKNILRILSTTLLLGVFPLVAPFAQTAGAATFNQNRIIDDGVFDNTNTMNASQIDTWLNTNFGSTSCISTSHGFSAPDPTGYNPTQGFLYGGNVSAGQVIYDAAQAYGINPRVLLTTLQKEQSLVSGTSGCNTLQYAAATGYGCPDGGTTYSYSGVNLYTINGTTVTSVSSTCVNSSLKVGFTQQVIRAAWLLRFGEQRSEGNISWAVVKGNWDNSDDPQSCYGGPMTQGTWARCPSGGSAYYDGYTTIDATAVHMDDGSTAALYWYTPHFSGNQNFFNIFTGWFGSTQNVPKQCDSTTSNVACVWELRTPDGTHFYTSSISERDYLISQGWFYIQNNFYVFASATATTNLVPVYRLYSSTDGYAWTASTSERDTFISDGWIDNGVAWYAYDPSVSDNVSIPIYRTDSPNGYGLYLANDIPSNVTNQGILFRTPAGITPTPSIPANGSLNVYRLWNSSSGYFYTTNFAELVTCARGGWTYNGTVFTASAAANATPVYRLSGWGTHMFTTSTTERDYLTTQGWTYEGVGWYGDTGQQIFRLSNGSYHFFTADIGELAFMVQHGWTYEGALVGQTSGAIPVARLNSSSDHFFTANPNELAMLLKSHYWTYEGVGWYASVASTSSPVYRLSGWGTHMFTTNPAERDYLDSHGWTYEGVGWYAY